ncbi:hypothetical protein JB92DRAFT_1149267 [Gautieria morchelliformis]|nr:hypothetical protein JB92DRAFT_1149267 [Gautieria morchelliformis]
MGLDDAELIEMVGGGGARIDGAAAVHVGVVERGGGVELWGVKGDVFLEADGEGHGGGGKTALAGHGFFGGGGGAAAAWGPAGRGVMLGLGLELVVLGDVGGREAEGVVLEGLCEALGALGRLVGGGDGGAEGGDRGAGGGGEGGRRDRQRAHVEREAGGGAGDGAGVGGVGEGVGGGGRVWRRLEEVRGPRVGVLGELGVGVHGESEVYERVGMRAERLNHNILRASTEIGFPRQRLSRHITACEEPPRVTSGPEHVVWPTLLDTR